jgi:hypothetical protein
MVLYEVPELFWTELYLYQFYFVTHVLRTENCAQEKVCISFVSSVCPGLIYTKHTYVTMFLNYTKLSRFDQVCINFF